MLLHLTVPIFTSGIVLLLKIWGGKHSGINIDPVKEMQDIHRCMSALSQAEKRWHSAGRLWDILYELTNVGDLQLPRTNPDPSNKRERDSDDPLSTEVSNTNTSQPVEGSRMIAGSRCVSSAKTTMQRQTVMQERPAQPRNELQLPIHTHDLGKLPLHPIVEYPAGVTPSLMGQQGPNTPIVPSMPTEGIRVNVDSANASLPSIYPLVYDDMITNFGGDLHGSAITSGSGGQTSGNLWGGWPGSFSLGPGELEPQSQQLSQPMVVMPGSEDTANPDTLVMWTNAPSGFEWGDLEAYIHNLSDMNLDQWGDRSGV